jgi:hypothetical protein
VPQRLSPQVLSVQLKQVEGVEENVAVLAALAKLLKYRQPTVVTAYGLAVNEAVLRWFTARTMSGNWALQSSPLRVSSRVPAASRRAMSRKPSCLIS